MSYYHIPQKTISEHKKYLIDLSKHEAEATVPMPKLEKSATSQTLKRSRSDLVDSAVSVDELHNLYNIKRTRSENNKDRKTMEELNQDFNQKAILSNTYIAMLDDTSFGKGPKADLSHSSGPPAEVIISQPSGSSAEANISQSIIEPSVDTKTLQLNSSTESVQHVIGSSDNTGSGTGSFHSAESVSAQEIELELRETIEEFSASPPDLQTVTFSSISGGSSGKKSDEQFSSSHSSQEGEEIEEVEEEEDFDTSFSTSNDVFSVSGKETITTTTTETVVIIKHTSNNDDSQEAEVEETKITEKIVKLEETKTAVEKKDI